MALKLKPVPVFEITTGQTVQMADYTGLYDADINPGGYGIPNTSIFAVNATRFIFSSYLTELAGTVSSVIVSGYEYVVSGSGSFTFDTKTYSAGDTFITMFSGTPTLSNCILTQTGRFCPVVTFIPQDVITDNFTPSLFGIDDTIFPDSAYNIQYDIFTTVQTAGSGKAAGTYIVIGDVGDTVTIAGVTWRIGEVFTQGSTFTFSGVGSIVLFNATTVDENGDPSVHYFQLSYYANKAIQDLELEIASSACTCIDKKRTILTQMQEKYDAVKINFKNDLSLSISTTQSLLDEIVDLGNNACNC